MQRLDMFIIVLVVAYLAFIGFGVWQDLGGHVDVACGKSASQNAWIVFRQCGTYAPEKWAAMGGMTGTNP